MNEEYDQNEARAKMSNKVGEVKSLFAFDSNQEPQPYQQLQMTEFSSEEDEAEIKKSSKLENNKR